MDRPGVRRVPEGSGKQGKMEVALILLTFSTHSHTHTQTHTHIHTHTKNEKRRKDCVNFELPPTHPKNTYAEVANSNVYTLLKVLDVNQVTCAFKTKKGSIAKAIINRKIKCIKEIVLNYLFARMIVFVLSCFI